MPWFSLRAFLFRLFLALAFCVLDDGAVVAAVVRNTLFPSDHIFSVQMQHACGVYTLQPSPHWCNPALFSLAEDSPIKGEMAVNADQNAYEMTDKLVNQPVDKPFIESLFKENNFQSFSGLGRLEALSSVLSFSYTPAFVVGAYKLSNPNLPEVSASAVKESNFRFTSGLKLTNVWGWSLNVGGNFEYYDRQFYYIDASALELIGRSIEDLLDEEHKLGVDGDVGFVLIDDSAVPFAPSFALVGENLFDAQLSPVGKDRPLSIEPIFRRRMRIHTGYTFTQKSGSYSVNLQLPFWDYFADLDRLGSSFGLVYGIGRLRVFTSFSALMSSFGFNFMGSYYHVGIQYTNEKQDNSLELKRRKNVNLFFSFNL